MKRIDKDLLERNIQKVAEYDFEHKKVFGSAYCVCQKNQIIYQKCFGYTSPDAIEPISEKTLFRLASMTKPITAVAILLLVDKGLLLLSDPIYKFLPEFAELHFVPAVNGKLVDMGITKKYPTIQDLLTHTSGIEPGPLKEKYLTEEDKINVDNYVKFALKAGLDYEPGSKQSYSPTLAYDILVQIIERVSGTNYQEFLKRELFEPCEMHDTVFVPSKEQWTRFVSMHTNVNGENAVAKINPNRIFGDFPYTHLLGGAGLASTLSDYVKFAEMLLNKGNTGKIQLLSSETLELMHTPYVSCKIMPGPESWGLGVRVIVDESYQSLPVGAYGWSGAYGSHFWVDPQNEIIAVFMKNSCIDGGSGNESACNFEKAVRDSLK